MDKELLLKPRLPESDVHLEIGTIRVRGLSRAEVLEFQQNDNNPDAFELRLMSLCLVDPKLTDDEISQWRQASLSNEIELVIERIHELSGLVQTSHKESYKSLPDESGEAVRVPTGSTARKNRKSTSQ